MSDKFLAKSWAVCKVSADIQGLMPNFPRTEAAKGKRNAAVIPGSLVLCGLVALVSTSRPTAQGDSGGIVSPRVAVHPVKSGDFFLRPFITDRGETVMSLDGGKHPVDNHALPSIAFGEDGDVRRLQVAMPLDWTKPECRKAYDMIRRLYAGKDAKGLPAIDLYLLPVFESKSGKAVHEAVLTVHLGSNRVDSLPGVLAGLGAGTLVPDASAIFAHVADADPDLASRWESLSNNQKERFSDAFQRASLQQRHNASRPGDVSLPQLIVFDSVLTGSPSRKMLADFLLTSASRQHDYLTSPEGAVRLAIQRGCKCGDPGHDHSPRAEISPLPLGYGVPGSGGD